MITKNGILIDINVLSSVFDDKNEFHLSFLPIKELIYSSPNNRAILIYGGSKYFNELKKTYTYLKLLLELNKQGKAKVICKDSIDKKEEQIKEICKDNDFDDPHLIALLSLTKSPVICTVILPFLTPFKSRRFSKVY